MKAHDIRTALSNVPLGAVTTAEENAAAFPKLASFDSGGVYVGRFSGGESPWERHPSADELIHVLDGEVDFTVLTNDGPVCVTVKAGCVFVVPRGMWHRPVARPAVTMLAVTPEPSEVSFEEPSAR